MGISPVMHIMIHERWMQYVLNYWSLSVRNSPDLQLYESLRCALAHFL